MIRPALIPGNTCRFLGYDLPTLSIAYTPQLSYSIQSLTSCLLFERKTTLHWSPLVKDHRRTLLFACYQALVCSLLCSSTQTFHLSFRQHLNHFAHAKGCCLPATQTGKGQPPRSLTPNLCCCKEIGLNFIHKSIMTGCPHSCILNTPHYFMGAQYRERPWSQITFKDIDEFH